ncbi:hypothetical protein CCP3SC1AL1_3010006 [Gammaproteobacteria bacterium]
METRIQTATELRDELRWLYEKKKGYDDRGLFNQDREIIDRKLNVLEAQAKALKNEWMNILAELNTDMILCERCLDTTCKIHKSRLDNLSQALKIIGEIV